MATARKKVVKRKRRVTRKRSPNLGGKRPGAGRPKLPESAKVKATKTLNLTKTVYADAKKKADKSPHSLSHVIDCLLVKWLAGEITIPDPPEN